MEKRQHERVAVGNLHVDIFDGQGFFSGTVEDLSRFGLKLNDVHKKLNDHARDLSLIVSGQGEHFKIIAEPKWTQGQSFSKKIGVEIVKEHLAWAEFVMKFEPSNHDVWDANNSLGSNTK
jgi:predicted SpoU family rRNA methylase